MSWPGRSSCTPAGWCSSGLDRPATSVSTAVWPTPSNTAIKTLEDLYRKTGNEKGLQALRERVSRLTPLKR